MRIVDQVINLTGYTPSDEAIRERRAALRAPVDPLASRMSFAESAARVLYGTPTSLAWIVASFMAQPHRPDVAGVLKSELVWAHRAALVEQRERLGSPIGERSDLP